MKVLSITFLILCCLVCRSQTKTTFKYNGIEYHNVNPKKVAEFTPGLDSIRFNKTGDTAYIVHRFTNAYGEREILNSDYREGHSSLSTYYGSDSIYYPQSSLADSIYFYSGPTYSGGTITRTYYNTTTTKKTIRKTRTLTTDSTTIIRVNGKTLHK